MPRVLKHDLDQFQAAHDLGRQLLLGDEQMRVVLGKAAHPGHAAQFTRLLPAIDGAELGQPDRHLAVAARLAGQRCGYASGSSSA